MKIMQCNQWIKRVCVSFLLIPVSVTAADVGGSADYPGVGRFKDSEITQYDAENYGETVLATGPVRKASDAETTALTVEGKINRIVYRVPPGVSALEVFRNFQAKISEAGYEEIFAGGPKEIDGYTFKYKHPVEILAKTSLGSKIYYLSAKKRSDTAEVYLALLVSPHSGGDGLRVRLIAAETKVMEMQMVDADAMASSITENGKVALYGIYFDTDSAEVKPASEATLNEISKLLKSTPALKIIVVGHTDYVGGYDYNTNLSRRRADAVVEVLINDYGIEGSRLSSAGVGYLAPAASNESKEGRELNRRVELVKDK